MQNFKLTVVYFIISFHTQGRDTVRYGDRKITLFYSLYRPVSTPEATTTNRKRAYRITPQRDGHSHLRYVIFYAGLFAYLLQCMTVFFFSKKKKKEEEEVGKFSETDTIKSKTPPKSPCAKRQHTIIHHQTATSHGQ